MSQMSAFTFSRILNGVSGPTNDFCLFVEDVSRVNKAAKDLQFLSSYFTLYHCKMTALHTTFPAPTTHQMEHVYIPVNNYGARQSFPHEPKALDGYPPDDYLPIKMKTVESSAPIHDCFPARRRRTMVFLA